MNVFILDLDHVKNASYYVDKHVVKIITEIAQLMSTAVRLSGTPTGYPVTHIYNPCTIWTQKSLTNWRWLLTFSTFLHKEWQYRYNHTRSHKAYSIILSLPEPNIRNIGLTPFALAMPDQYKTSDPVQSYRNYYIGEKQHLFRWTKRPMPEWIKNEPHLHSNNHSL